MTIDVIGLGNALVDVLVRVDDDFIDSLGLTKGSMTLIDTQQADAIYSKLGPAIEASGGSGANTMAGIASLGGKAAYIGKVASDQLGTVFRHDIQAAGVQFTTETLNDSTMHTGRCLVMVSPDAQRTMATYLGASTLLTPRDIDAALIASARVCYLEGYLFDPPDAKEAFYAAADIAKENDRKVALTLSDTFCVERHRDDFRDLVQNHVDILFANEMEIMALYGEQDFKKIIQAVRADCDLAVLTRSEKGSVIVHHDQVYDIVAQPCDVVDTTGAGDLYAAGFLYGYTRNLPLAECGRIASIAAAEIISHIGARPQTQLADLI